MKLKSLIFVISYFVIVHVGFCQGGGAPNKTDKKGQKQGLWEKHYENGNLMYSAEFKDDKPIGELRRYYEEDGSLQAIIHYTPDRKARAKIFYPETGTLLAEGNYVNQKKDSVWFFYSPDSVLTSKETYRNDLKHGLSTIYFRTGQITEKAMYQDGVQHGIWEQYFEDGTPKLKANVYQGESYEGEYISYYEDGKKMIQGSYKNGEKESSWYHYNPDGSIEIIYVYRAGKLQNEHPQNGVFTDYFPDDIKKSEYTYKDGKKHGPFKEFYPMGEWKTEEVTDEFGNSYPVQKLHGTQIKREGKYRNGELHGEVVTYHESGKVKERDTYDMGEVVD